MNGDWDAKVERIVRTANRRGAQLFWLGLGIYGTGSAIIFSFLWKNPTIATAFVMFLFQLCMMFFGTKKMYPKFDGAFWLQIEANRDAVPTFAKLAQAVSEAEKEAVLPNLTKSVKDLKESVSGLKLDEFRLAFERKMDEVKEKLDEHLGANDPPLTEGELAALEKKASR